ncbi:dCTP deaminase [Candidatus Dojkabacteria bacterium]|uniref:dCTP deaminase, dUMP-forming n=1 Tax=Candidatus Dojkabacteria bacterium TaxID=2099670 RepID=A0A955KUS6_9BACT|nr:dCTP deaminase [Candidatus Dojkabacteria bacterium]MCB9791070.1 dCTP deaminase [Candidatus Nomurabacteria bacterium]
MVLSDKDIVQAMKTKDIIISPFDKHCLQPASVDLHLDKHFLVFDTSSNYVIDPKKSIDGMMKEISINDTEPFVLHPKEFALGLIYETTGVSSKYVGRLEGKSSVGRMGLLIHVTAGFLDPGNSLKMTLELHNTANLPILLYYKMPIAQMAFEKLSSECENPYSTRARSKYVGDVKPRPSQMWRNFV